MVLPYLNGMSDCWGIGKWCLAALKALEELLHMPEVKPPCKKSAPAPAGSSSNSNTTSADGSQMVKRIACSVWFEYRNWGTVAL